MPLAADVLLPLPLAPLRWLVPFAQEAGPVGARLVVPWRGGARIGLVTALEEVSGARALELKEAIGWLDHEEHLPAPTVDWLLSEAARTACPPGVVLAGLSCPGLRVELDHQVREIAHDGDDAAPFRAAASLDPARLDLAREQGLLEERVRVAVPTRSVLIAVGEGDPEAELPGAARANQRRALRHLRRVGGAESGAEAARNADVPESAVRALVRKGLASYEERPLPLPPPPAAPPPVPWPADRRIPDAGDGPARLLVGGGDRAARLASLVPGLRRDLAAGASPVLLAPERALAQEAAAWLANDVPVLLSRLDVPQREREAFDRAVRAAPPTVLVGTWPVLAAPVARPGRLVVLECGSESHKLRSGSRSFAPDAASGWARAHGVVFVATDVVPGPEARALAGDGATRLELPRPRVRWHASDLAATHAWPLGDELVRVLRQVAARRRQAVVLVPRRGFSAALGCRDCGAVSGCPNCDLALRWHAREGRLRCHQCGHAAPPPRACPDCGGTDLGAQRAAGSEWVTRALAGVVPDLPLLRYDADVRDDPTPLYEGRPGVLVGTSAVLRLPPLPVLSLLAVTQVDGGLHADDFRAEERTLRTLLSLGALAGERAPLGVVQTFSPGHPLLRALVDGSDPALRNVLDEMEERRRAFGYPPFGHLTRVQVSARAADAAWRAAETLADRLRAAGAGPDEVLGPAPAPVARVRGRSLVQLLLRTDTETRRGELLAGGVDGGLRGARVRIDVDPRDIGDVLE